MSKKRKNAYKKQKGVYVVDIIELNNQVTSRKNGLLQFRYYDTLGCTKYIYGHTIEEIAAKYNIILNTNSSMFLDYSSTVDEAFMAMINRTSKDNVKPETYSYNIAEWSLHISPYIGSRKITDITFDELQALFDEYHRNKMSYRIRTRLFSKLKATFEYAIIAGVLERNIVRGIVVKKDARKNHNSIMKDNTGLKILSISQIEELLEITKGTSVEIIVKIALHTGMRCGEILALRRSSIDLENDVIHVRATLTANYYYDKTDTSEFLYGTAKTKSSERDIPIHKNIRDDLINLKEFKFRVLVGDTVDNLHFEEIDDFLIKSPMNKLFSVSTVDSIIRRRYAAIYREKTRMAYLMGRPIKEFYYFTMHDLRATVATKLFKDKVDLLDVKNLLGHKDASTTLKYYLKSTEEGRKNIINRLDILNDD